MINESSGICNSCNKGDHDQCEYVLGRSVQGPVFCTCWCTGDTSLGNAMLYKEPIPQDVKDEFPTLERPEDDPLKDVFK